jgi:hypothetical protein
MRIAFTGGTGFVGGHLAATLSKLGHDVVVHVPDLSRDRVSSGAAAGSRRCRLAPDRLPEDLMPATAFDESGIRAGLPEPGPFGLDDLRWSVSRKRQVGQGSRPRST